MMSLPTNPFTPRQLSPQELALLRPMMTLSNLPPGGPHGGHWQAPTPLPGYSPQAGSVTNWRTSPFPYPGAVYIAGTDYYAREDPIEDAGIRPGEVTAWRCWRLRQGLLWSMAMSSCIWAPDEPMEGDPSGKAYLGAAGGVHAWKKFHKALEYAGSAPAVTIIGQVELWGEIVEHEHGYRAENAAIVSLDGILDGSQEQLDAVRKIYGVGGRDGLVVEPLYVEDEENAHAPVYHFTSISDKNSYEIEQRRYERWIVRLLAGVAVGAWTYIGAVAVFG